MAKFGFSADLPWPPPAKTRCERLTLFRHGGVPLMGVTSAIWGKFGVAQTSMTVSPFFEAENYSDLYCARWACAWAPNSSAANLETSVALVSYGENFTNEVVLGRLTTAQVGGVNNDGGDITTWFKSAAMAGAPLSLGMVSQGDGTNGCLIFLSEVQLHRFV